MAHPKHCTSLFDAPPRKHVLLLSCMDQRLLDNTVDFMNELNLQNRYDQVILAGAAMGARRLSSNPIAKGPELLWKTVFFDHLATAIDKLDRDIGDIFLLEHLDCGAYKVLHPKPKTRKKYKLIKDVSQMRKFHALEACRFAAEIEGFCKRHAQQNPDPDRWKGIHVHCLLMDLVGRVSDL